MKFKIPPKKGLDTELLENSDRGFRFEVYLNVATGKSIYQYEKDNAIEALEQEFKKYHDDHPTLVQVYFYLTEYKEKRLDQIAFENMDRFIQKLSSLHLKAVLRFAYVWDDGNPMSQEPKEEQIYEHLDQLRPYLKKWSGQIHVLQAGIIGAWGEWSFKSRERSDEGQILNKIIEATPKDMKLQVRYWDIKQKLLSQEDSDFQRIGYHDDFLIGNLHGWNTAGGLWESAANHDLRQDSRYQLVDGEMIWWWANPIYLNNRTIDPEKMAKRLANGHFTSLSLTHNYKDMLDGNFSKFVWENELKRNNKNPDEYLSLQKSEYSSFSSINAWKNQTIEMEKLLSLGLPYDPAWFLNREDQVIQRNWYEYFRDFLGYRINCESIELKEKNKHIEILIHLINRGFAAPVGLEKITIQVFLKDKKIISADFFELNKLQSMKPLTIDVALFNQKFSPDDLSISLKLQAKDGSGNRLANDIAFKDQLNWLFN
ncbi:DUF4874 domain-containing protein [Enterococcus sp. ALS3]|uniref:DUF4874 domain-containing protein n=1 Tax=Enterococcus alishanensis TaxID=1303817 RepID=A0ABS6TDK4_9ENTE|nr:DUF4874 domain-containing protein [Enterococcus alishanensis]